jgi:hypothetical protein
MGGCFISEFLKNHNRRLTTSQITTKHWFGVRTGVGWFLDRGIGICRLSAWAYTHWFSKIQITNFGIWPWFSKIKITKYGIWPWFLAIQITNFDIWPWLSKLCKSKLKKPAKELSVLCPFFHETCWFKKKVFEITGTGGYLIFFKETQNDDSLILEYVTNRN